MTGETNIGGNSLPNLAAAISDAHRACKLAAVTSAEQAIEAGTLLIEAKALVPHSEWNAWLMANVGFSERTARRYMQLARSGLKTATVADLGIRGAMEKLANECKHQETLRAADEMVAFFVALAKRTGVSLSTIINWLELITAEDLWGEVIARLRETQRQREAIAAGPEAAE